MKKFIVPTAAFFAVQAMAWFCFWIGGGQLFTEAAGAIAVTGCGAGIIASHIARFGA